MENKQMAAVAAAVFEYIRSEEEAVCRARTAPAAAPPAPPPPPKMWGLSGRRQQMDLRNLMQWRAFVGARMR